MDHSEYQYGHVNIARPLLLESYGKRKDIKLFITRGH